MQSQDSRNTILSSWKEIAAYLGRGVRTVQRYESRCALPIRRPVSHDKRIVMALPAELDAWTRRQHNGIHIGGSETPAVKPLGESRDRLEALTIKLTNHVTTLQSTIAKLIAMSEANSQD